MHQLILLGPPGAGKGTQAGFICQELGIPQVSTGQILREAIASKSPLGLTVNDYVTAGELVPDDLIIKIVAERIAEADCQKGFLLDGFPRTIVQAEALEAAGIHIDEVLEITCPDEVIIERISGRRTHPGSGRVYHIHSSPPQQEGLDDITGEPLIQRADDLEETVRNRLNVYRAQTEPLVAFYCSQVDVEMPNAPRYWCVDGHRDVEVVRNDVMHLLTANEMEEN